MDNLNDKLKKWGEHFPSKKDPMDDSLSDKIIANLREKDAPREFVLKPGRGRLFWAQLAFSMGILLLVINIFFPLHQRGQETFVQRSLPLKPGELEEIRLAANVIEQMFPEGVLWISRSEGAMDIHSGPSSAAEDVSAKDKILIVLQLIETNTKGSTVVHRQDLIVRDGEPIQLDNGEKIALWTYRVDNDHISIEMDGSLKNDNIQVRIRDQFLQSFGEQKLIGQEGSYEVYQTAYQL